MPRASWRATTTLHATNYPPPQDFESENLPSIPTTADEKDTKIPYSYRRPPKPKQVGRSLPRTPDLKTNRGCFVQLGHTKPRTGTLLL